MSKLQKLLDFLTGYRKLTMALLGLFTLQVFACVAIVIFVGNWYLGTDVLSGENFKDILVAVFQYDAAIIAAYAAANVCVKVVDKWKRKK